VFYNILWEHIWDSFNIGKKLSSCQAV